MWGKVLIIVHLLRAKTQETKSYVKHGLDYVERIGRKTRPLRNTAEPSTGPQKTLYIFFPVLLF